MEDQASAVRCRGGGRNDDGAAAIFSTKANTNSQGMRTVLEVLNTTLNTPKFQESMRKCFIQVGLVPGADGQFIEYSPTRKGILTQIIPQVQVPEEAVSVGELASEVCLIPRPEDGPDGEPLEEEEGEEGEEGEEEGEEGE